MVRNYKRQRDKKYSNENLLQAVEAVKTKKMNSYKASEVFGIPRSTIVAHITGTRGQKMPNPGKPTVFSKQQEEHLACLLHVIEKAGHPLTRKELKTLIAEYVRRNGIVTPFKNDIPGDDWCHGFMKRNKLSMKKPQGVEVARKKACNPFTIYHYFDLLESAVQDLNLHGKPERIFNIDETSFCNDPTSGKIVGQKGYPSTRTTSGPGRDNTTVLLGANARGDKIPPLIVFKGKSLWNEWFYKNENVQTAYSVSKNGWMETSIFEKYIKDVFLPSIGSERPVLLVYDGHKTHVDLGVIELAVANNVTILKLPPHSSHVLQPLDVSAMKPMKVHWEDALIKWQRLHSGAKLPKSEFARLLTETWDNLNPVILQNGFIRSGLYPVDRNAVSKENFDIISWSKWEQSLKDNKRSEENTEEDLHSEKRKPTDSDLETVPQAQLPLNDNPNSYSNEVPSLKTLVLNHINDEQNCNILKKIPFEKTEYGIKTGKIDIALISKNEMLKTPGTFNKDVTPSTSSVSILNCQVFKKGDPNYVNVTFEELMLKAIARNDPPKNPRKRVHKGAEILTYKDVINSMKKEKENKDIEIERKETLKRIKIEGQNVTKKKTKTTKKENKKNRIKKKSTNKHKNSSDTEGSADSSFSLKDTTDEEDATDFFNSLLDEEKENEDLFINEENLSVSQGASSANKLAKNITSTKKSKGNITTSRNNDDKYNKTSTRFSKEYKNAVKVKDSNNLYNDYNLPSTSKEEPKPVLEEGRFLLVKFPTAKGKKDYKYVCVIESISDEKVVVKGFKSYRKNKRFFRVVKTDISIIDITQIVMYLPTPVFDKHENVFVFPFDIPIVEL